MDAHCGKQPPGRFVPHINRNRCEGKGDCVAVCPYGVFTVATLGLFDRRSLTLVGQFKGWAHDWQQAFAVNAAACEACGHCVSACPEDAITLVRADANNPPHASTAAD